MIGTVLGTQGSGKEQKYRFVPPKQRYRIRTEYECYGTSTDHLVQYQSTRESGPVTP